LDPSGALVVLLLDGSFKALFQYLVILILERSAAFREVSTSAAYQPSAAEPSVGTFVV
jgi:hypothetical protein